MVGQGRAVIIWLTWFFGGVCGVTILLVVICYCCPMPRQKSLDEKYLKDKHKDVRSATQECSKVKMPDPHRHTTRPVSYAGPVYYSHKSSGRDDQAGAAGCSRQGSRDVAHGYVNNVGNIGDVSTQYASSGMLDEIDNSSSMDALKTRSLPAFLRPKPRPLSTEDDLQQLYAKVHYSKKYKNRMRNDHAAIIALSKSHSQFLDADAVIVYDQRTAL